MGHRPRAVEDGDEGGDARGRVGPDNNNITNYNSNKTNTNNNNNNNNNNDNDNNNKKDTDYHHAPCMHLV